MKPPQVPHQPRLSAEPLDVGDVLVVVVCVTYMVAAMAGSIYLTCDDEARVDAFGFIAPWLRELVLLALLVVGLFVAATMKVWNVLCTWVSLVRSRRPFGENAL